MKFEQFNVLNFKGVESLSYTPKNKIAVLMGANGRGKTSTLESIRFLLTGNAPDECIRIGTTSTSVSAIVDGIGEISREKFLEKPTKVRVNGKVTPAKNLDSMFETVSGVNKDALKITTSADIVNGLSAAEFGNFIMQYIPEELNLEIISNYITSLTPEGEKELADIFPAMPATFGIDMVNTAEAYFVDLRKSLKKEIANREAKTKTFFGEKPTRTLPEIENELNELIVADGSIETARKALQIYTLAVENRKKAENNLNALRAQIDSITATKPNPDDLRKIKERIDYHNKEIVSAEKMSQTIKDNIALFTSTIENLSKPICPLSEKLVCTTDKTAIKNEFEEVLVSNEEGLVIQTDIIARNKAEIEKLEVSEKEYLKNEAEYNKKTILANRYEKDKKTLPVVPTKPEVLEIKDYKEDIKRVQKERDSFKAYKENEKLIDETNILNERLNCICFLIKALEAKGEVMNSIMTHYMSMFESVINERADKLGTGIKAKFIAEQGVNYLIQIDSKIGFLPYDSLSHGEQTVAMFLLLDMLNALCGTRLLLMDDLNHLDPNSLDILMKLITSAPVLDDYDHIFISSVNNTDMVNVVSKYTAGVDLIF